MTKSIFVFLTAGGNGIARILQVDSVAQSVADMSSADINAANADNVVAVLSGEDVSTWAIDLPDLSDNKLLQILPAQLEDYKAISSPDDHYALLSKNDDGKRLVACVSAMVMNCARKTLTSAGVNPDFLVPDYGLVAIESDIVVTEAVVGRGRYTVRLPDGSGFSGNQLLVQEVSPNYAASNANLFSSPLDDLSRLNLLQGRYKPRLAIAAYFTVLQRTVTLLGAVLLVWVASVFLDAQQREKDAETLRAKTEQLFKSAFPDITRIVDMEAQARRMVVQSSALQGGEFLNISERIFEVVAGYESAALEGMRFNKEQNSFLVTMSFGTFAESDGLLSQLRNTGLTVTEGGSRQKDGRVITDIAIGGVL